MRVRFAKNLVRAAACSLVAAASFAAVTAEAQGLLDADLRDPGPAPAIVADDEPAEYSRRIGAYTPTEIIQQKAQIRAAERMSRIASKAWYGYKPERPQTTATPFGGMYGAQYRGRVLGRPGAFFPSRSLVVVR